MSETVTIFRSWVEIAEALPSDAARGRLYHAICRYALDGKQPALDGVLKSYFTLMQPSIDKSNRRRFAQERSAAKRSEKKLQNGSQCNSESVLQNGLQNSLQNSLQNDPENSLQTDQKTVCPCARKTETKTETKKETVPKGTAKKKGFFFEDSIPERFRTDAFLQVWREWVAARREQKKPLTQCAVTRQIDLLAQYGEPEAIEMLRTSIRNNWQGVFPLKKNAKTEGEIYVPRH